MADPIRALLRELLDYAVMCGGLLKIEGLWDEGDDCSDGLLDRARAALAAPTPELDTDVVLKLAAIIREVGSINHRHGAAALAEAILSHSAAGEVFSGPPPAADGEAIGPEWRPCVKLPITVHVREQRPGETHVSTREGITPVNADDLIMRGVQGEEYPIGRELFNRTYRLGPAPASAESIAPPANREAQELATLLAVGSHCAAGAKLSPEQCRRAAALLRQLAPEGLMPAEYFHIDSGARVVHEPCDGEPGWCWTVRNHRHVNPCTEFPTLAAAWEALQQARQEEAGND